MMYFWGLLKAEFVKSIKLAFRYKFNTLFNILFWAVLMVLLSHVLLRGKPEVKTWAFICSFMIWLIANNSFISVVDSIVSETVQGNNRTAVSQFKIFLYITSGQGLVSSVITIHPVRSHTVYLRSSGPFRASESFLFNGSLYFRCFSYPSSPL